MSAGSINAISPTTSGSAASRSTGSGTRSRSSTASTRGRRSPRKGRACWSSTMPHNWRRTSRSTCPISPQFDLRERRDIGTVRVSATPTTHVDITGGFTTTRHSGELPWGASFGFSNDNEVALPYRSRTNDMDVGAQWTNTRAMIRAAYNGSWFHNLDDTLTWDNPLSADGHHVSARSRPNGAVAVQFPPDTEHGRLCKARASHAAHRFAGLRLVEQQRGSAAVHRQQRPDADAAAARRPRRPRPTRSRPTSNLVSRPLRQLAIERPLPALRLQQRDDPKPPFRSSSTTTRRWRRARPVVQSSLRTTATRSTPKRRGRPWCGGADGRVHQQPQRLRLSHLRVEQRERAAAQGGRGRLAVGDLPRPLRIRQPHRLGPRRGVARSRSASSRSSATTISRTVLGIGSTARSI